jgi:Fe2+ or Zn2+ uptake regulation protein
VKLPPELLQRFAASGIRLTKQREEVLVLLMQKRDHPTAAEVFLRAKRRMPSISLATVYNCLEALVGWGVVKQVNLDRAPTRYCANLQDHSHFQCESCGTIFDVDMPFRGTWNLPVGFVIHHAEVSLKGLCAKCAAERYEHRISALGSAVSTGQNPILISKNIRRNS